MSATPLTVQALTSVAAIDAAVWDGLVAGASPFLRHAFLSALEESGCTGERAGWLPFHIAAYEGARLIGLAPAFIKAHSMGEFVYDWVWADAAQRLGIDYYPKLVLAAPFSPVSGRRLLTADGVDPDAMAEALLHGAIAHARAVGCSGVHVLFCTAREVRLAERLGFCHRLGCQFHWRNEGYRDFEDYLARFDSKRRNQIRRERRRVREQAIRVASYRGEAVTDAMMAPAFDFYGATVDRYVWGRRYLNQRFFEELWRTRREDLQLTLAHRVDGRETLVGGAINFEARVVNEGPPSLRRFGRYWGARAEIDALHFEVCAYAPIEDCIARGVEVFEAGAGGDQHKLVRGFLPAPTHSAHLLFEPRFHDAVADFCRREERHVADQIARLGEGVFAR